MPDLTDNELRELDLWVAEVCGVSTEVDHGDKWLFDIDGVLYLHDEVACQACEDIRDYQSDPWHPHASCDQAVEHLGPVLEERRLGVQLRWERRDRVLAWIHKYGRPWLLGDEPNTPALAFVLAAKAALEKDDGCNRKT